MTVGRSNISVGTNSPSGYRLYLGMTGNSNALIHSTDPSKTITSSGTFENPTPLTNGTWGYAIPHDSPSVLSTNGFDASYNVIESSVPDTTAKFSSIPVANTTKIAETNELGDNTFPVYYGVRVGYETVAGTYTNKVMYTALADNAPLHEMTASPTRSLAGTATPISITTTTYSTAANDFDAFLLTGGQYDAITSGASIEDISGAIQLSCMKESADPIELSCTIPATAPAGTYHLYVVSPTYGEDESFETEFVVAGSEFFNITNMQEMTSSVCASATTPSVSAAVVDTDGSHAGDTSYVPQSTLYDIRDGEAYTVRKLADGNCWMTENLRLGDAEHEITLTPQDSNIATNFTLPVGENWAENGHKWGDGNNSSQDRSLVDEKHAYIRMKETYGAVYNYYTAIAGTKTYAETTTPEYDICPKGFALPAQSNFYGILSTYSIPAQNTTVDAGGVFNAAILDFPLNFNYSGHYWCGGSTPRGNKIDSHAGGWWTSTVYTSTEWHKVKGFYIENYTRVVLNANWGLPKQDGFSIRCVAK